MGRRRPNPYESQKHSAQELPFIRGSKVLLDPALVEQMKHICKPWDGGQTLNFERSPVNDEEGYVDVNLMFMALLNEVIHLRKQIGLVCEGAYIATNGHFHVPIRDHHCVLDGKQIDRDPVLEDYCVVRPDK
jgi:hypothetical protein